MGVFTTGLVHTLLLFLQFRCQQTEIRAASDAIVRLGTLLEKPDACNRGLQIISGCPKESYINDVRWFQYP